MELFCLQNSVVSIVVIFMKCIHVPIAKYQTSSYHPPSAGLVYFFVCVFAPKFESFVGYTLQQTFFLSPTKSAEKKLSFVQNFKLCNSIIRSNTTESSSGGQSA